jgi:exosortase/archaeosortase family protein
MDILPLRPEQNLALTVALLCACLVVTFGAFRSVFASAALSLDYATLKQNGFYLWAVAALCVGWLYLKRTEILSEARSASDSKWLLFGAILVGSSLGFLYYVTAFLNSLPAILFGIGFVIVAQFTLWFGKASKIPLMLLGLFGIAVGFPVLLESALAVPFARVTAMLTVSTLQLFRLPITLQGVTVTVNSLLGNNIAAQVDTRCAGSDSLAIFLAIFGLMLIDRRPQNKALVGLLILGVVGTYLQNFVRLLLLFAAGYYYGADALWAVHDYGSYVLFPLWFLGFAIIYLRYARKPAKSAIERLASTESSLEL